MDVFTFLVIIYSLIDRTKCLEETLEESLVLQILPESVTNGQHIILKQVDETLNLFCNATTNRSSSNYKLSWKLPHLTQNSQNRVVENSSRKHDGWELVIENLKESDTGDYECLAQSTTLPNEVIIKETVRVNVKNKKSRCDSEQMFSCMSGICIFQRFVCDGYEDCKDGADEDKSLCGLDPCKGKLHCPDGRCMSKDLCCDQHTDPDCTVKIRPNCCPIHKGSLTFTKYGDEDQQHRTLDDHQRFSDMGFLQTTIYTVIGCAMAFMFIVTILVIAICRVHMKRTLLSRCPNARSSRNSAARGRGPTHHHGVAHMPLYDLDVFLNRGSPFPADMSPHSSLLVTYNINNGVQFVGRPVDPPPYCEVVASPPREGPPPPYVSHENLRVPQETREAESGENATENDALLSRESRGGNNTLRITVVNTAPRGDGGARESGLPPDGRYRLVAIRAHSRDEDETQNDLNANGRGAAPPAVPQNDLNAVPHCQNILPASEPNITDAGSRNARLDPGENDLNAVHEACMARDPPQNLNLLPSPLEAAAQASIAMNSATQASIAANSATQAPIATTSAATTAETRKPRNHAQLRKDFFGVGSTSDSVAVPIENPNDSATTA